MVNAMKTVYDTAVTWKIGDKQHEYDLIHGKKQTWRNEALLKTFEDVSGMV